ncbi:MAG: sugar phosphate isomerase/epimerase family protein [Planctomycetota bacterium]
MLPDLNRRQWLQCTGAISTAMLAGHLNATQPEPTSGRFPRPRLSLNTSTLRGHQLGVPEQIRVTADAGYDGIEPWMGDLRRHVEAGGRVSDLRKLLDDSGLELSGAIGFAKWIVDDPAARQDGLDEARRDMALVRELGGHLMAAPPIGAHRLKELGDTGPPSLDVVAQRYAALLDLGKEMGVTPLLELWGFSPVLSKLGELAYVSAAAGRSNAAVLPDFYHIYKGGNDMISLGMIEASRMPLFHINDYPKSPPIESIADRDRVYPGDGICPLVPTIATLIQHGFAGTFSLELFNPTYWGLPADEVAATGFRKSQQVIEAALALASKGDRSIE